MKPLMYLFCALLSFSATAQNTCNLSDVLNIEDRGKNKLLLSSNGNTLLFHFGNGQLFKVSVFDANHKLIVTNTAPVKVLDLNVLKNGDFEGLFETYKEAVLFFAETIYGKRSLIRYRFSIENGKMLEEKIVLEGERQIVNNRYFILHLRGQKNYSIFCYRDVFKNPQYQPILYRYNEKNDLLNAITLAFPKGDDIDHHLNAVTISPEGSVAVAMHLGKGNQQMERAASGMLVNMSDMKYYFAYCASNDTAFKTTLIDAPQQAHFHSNPTSATRFIFNEKEHKAYLAINDMMTNMDDTKYALFSCLLFSVNTQSMAVNSNWMYYKYIDYDVKHSPDSSSAFSHHPAYFFMHDTDMLLVSIDKRLTWRSGFDRPLMPILGLTRLSMAGNETWGRMLPYSAFANSKDENAILRRKNFVSDYVYPLDTACTNTGTYLFFNDYENTFYYKIGTDLGCDLYYPFGKPAEGHTKMAFNDSSDYDPESSTYATVFIDVADKKATPYIAWCHLL